jgi:hypothetical protein
MLNKFAATVAAYGAVFSRDRINHFFDTLDLLVVRLTLFVILVVGAYTLIRGHL